MEMVRRLPCNWKQIDDRDLIGTVEYAPVESMRRAGCCGEARLWRLASRGVTSLGNRCGVMKMTAYLTPCLLSPRLRRHRRLPVLRGKQRERASTEFTAVTARRTSMRAGRRHAARCAEQGKERETE